MPLLDFVLYVSAQLKYTCSSFSWLSLFIPYHLVEKEAAVKNI